MRPIDYFFRSVKKSPNSLFLLDQDVKYSYLESQERILRVSRSLYGAGFKIGDSVAVYSGNNAEAVICVFSCMCSGGAWIPVNIRNSPETNAEYMAYVRTKWLFFHSDACQKGVFP